MLRVGINGYGTIGKRVADAVRAQPDMSVAGVAKRRPDYVAAGATRAGYSLYAAEEGRDHEFEASGLEIDGHLEDLVADSDVVVDATPAGIGAENRPLYERHDTPAIFQGGEEATVAEVSFNARANFEEAADAEYVRVVSCNTTGLARLLTPLEEDYEIDRARVTLVRRGGDPAQSNRGPIDDVVLDPPSIPSHHGPDVGTVLPGLDVDTIALRVPTTLMHVHAVTVTFVDDPSEEAVRDCLQAESRIAVVPSHAGIDGPGKVKDLAKDRGRPRGDVWENVVWDESLTLRENELHCVQAIHQEADVVPETVDAIRALTGGYTVEESMALTDESMGIGFEEFAPITGPTADRSIAD